MFLYCEKDLEGVSSLYIRKIAVPAPMCHTNKIDVVMLRISLKVDRTTKLASM